MTNKCSWNPNFIGENNKKGSDFIQVIEINITIDSNNIIRNHQSRIVEVDSWETCCKAYEEYAGKSIAFYSKGMPGNTIQSNYKMLDLIYDKKEGLQINLRLIQVKFSK